MEYYYFDRAMTVDVVLDLLRLSDDRRCRIRLLVPEDLSKGCDLPSLCDDLEFRLGRPSLKIRSSVFFLRQSQLLVGSSFSSGLEGSAERPISNDNRPLLMITYVNPV